MDATDPLDPTPSTAATQNTFNQLAAECDIISSFWYPGAGNDWSKIKPMADSGKPLYFLANNNQSTPFWYTIEVSAQANADVVKSIIYWQIHRALAEGARGVLFYSWGYTSATARTDVDNVIKDLTTNTTMDVVLDRDRKTTDVSFTRGGSKVSHGYWEYDGEHYLLVVDTDVISALSKSFTVQCDIGTSQYADFELVIEQYSGGEITSSKVSSSKVEFSDSIPRGEAKFYRMVVQD